MAGCGHMTISGQWSMSSCNAKLDTTICEMNTGMVFLKSKMDIDTSVIVRSCHVRVEVITRYWLIESIHVFINLVITS